ncbi:hypothetical protein LIS82_26890 (plasmid) [Cytobacillus solani]|uniref:hypothetical protein n=1 Tax=Cytobacillus solani TaxID=1637975 RepID=UPI00207B06D3|nr:hypothetical protein [Cytobacillus solani]USK57847.1 hypothetical protein LIS82_26890 [Cytobacillus solani]
MDKQDYRNLTSWIGIGIIVLSGFKMVGVFKLSILAMFCVSAAALIFSITDLLMEKELVKNKKHIWLLDGLAISFLVLAFCEKLVSKIDFTVPSENVTLLAFGIVIFTIGIRNKKWLSKIISELENKIYTEKSKRFPTLDSPEAKQAKKDLALYEYNTILHLNKVILELKKCDNVCRHTGSFVHDGWACLSDCLEYYRITSEDPFYDTGLNNLYWKFDENLTNGTNIISNIADYDHRDITIAKIIIWGNDFDVKRSKKGRNTNIEDYKKAHQYFSQALQEWEQLLNIATSRYQKLGEFNLDLTK